MSAARQALWRDARILSGAGGPPLSPRFRRMAVRGDRPLSLADVDGAPDWAAADAPDRARLARLTGAVLVSRSWSSSISGAVLGRAAQAVGEAALDAVISLPSLVAPQAQDARAAEGHADALDRLGACALLSAAGVEGGRRDRLARLFPQGADGRTTPADATVAQHTAESLRLSVDGAGG